MSRLSEDLVEPFDGVVAKYIYAPVCSHIDAMLSSRGLHPIHLPATALLSALISGLASYLGEPLPGGILALTALLASWLGWRRVERLGAPRSWIIIGSTLDRIGEIFIVSGMIASPLTARDPCRIIGILALAGSLAVSYTAVRAGREFKAFTWKGFSAYGATRDVRFTVIAVSSILNAPSLGLILLAALTLTVVAKRILDLFSLR
ncbi:MAG: hypothetical protein QW638_08460 [Candidatus Bathyarchaeia archaeon]|nr:hypothetical protein [Candidatus Bathyarchaeota archaeon]